MQADPGQRSLKREKRMKETGALLGHHSGPEEMIRRRVKVKVKVKVKILCGGMRTKPHRRHPRKHCGGMQQLPALGQGSHFR